MKYTFFIQQIHKKSMTKFSNKPYFWPIFPIWGQKIFFEKPGSVTHNNTLASNTMLSFRKNL